MPPYCEEHRMYHDRLGECQRMRAKTRAEAKAAALRARAERIAADALNRHASIHAQTLTGANALTIATAAALQALAEASTDHRNCDRNAA